jgi:hypothetical protein
LDIKTADTIQAAVYALYRAKEYGGVMRPVDTKRINLAFIGLWHLVNDSGYDPDRADGLPRMHAKKKTQT